MIFKELPDKRLVSVEATYGTRVRVAPTDLEQWTNDALKAFTGVEGTIVEVSENPFDRKTPTYLVEFDKPVRKWVMLSESEPDTNPVNFFSCFHFAGCDLTALEPTIQENRT